MATKIMAGVLVAVLAVALVVPATAVPAKKPPRPRAMVKGPPTPAAIAPLADTPEIAALRSAYAFAVPVYAMMRARHVQLSAAAKAGAPGVNHLDAQTALPGAPSRDGFVLNADTLDASAWLDLAGGPVILDAPAMPDRYHSATLTDLFADVDAVVGTSTGGKGRRYLIAGPGWRGDVPKGLTLLRATTNDAWLLVRVRVGGADDLAAATGLLRGFTIEVPRDNEPPQPLVAVPTAVPDAATLIAVIDEALARTPLPPAIVARSIHPALGISAEHIDPALVPPATMALWRASFPALRAELRHVPIDRDVEGWRPSDPAAGHFGDDDAARARVATAGLGALPRSEAIDLTVTRDKDAAPLTGPRAYTVHIPAKPPVGGFWSLTMVAESSDGRLGFVATPSQRFAISDLTRDLRPERDGSFDIFVQVSRPSGERVVNWLPAPAGRFRLIFRAWLPRAALLDGSFTLPPVEATEAIE